MKKSFLCFIFVFVILLSTLVPTTLSRTFAKSNSSSNIDISLSAKSAILVDDASGEIIFEKNSRERLPIASMTKLASLAVVFDAISSKILKQSDSVVVSQTAASVGGSSAFLDAGSSYNLSELIKTIIIASANDSCVAVAEFVSGSEELFVSRMNKFVDGLGLKDTHFANCTGLPTENHYSSAYDMVQIYKTILDNEIYKSYSKIWMEDFIHPSGRRTQLVNTNRLVKTYDGIEGGKTGYTDAARFCLTASARRAGMRLIGVVIGVDDSKTRFAEMSKLFDYGFANYKIEEIVSGNVPVTIVKAKKAKNIVEIYPVHGIVKFFNKSDIRNFSVDYQIYDIKAPLSKGDTVGKLFVFDENNMVVDEVELIAGENIEAIDFAHNMKNILRVW